MKQKVILITALIYLKKLLPSTRFILFLSKLVALKRTDFCLVCGFAGCLASEAVQSASLPLQGIDHIHSGDGLPLGVFGVGDSVPDNVLKENLEDATSLLVDEARDPLDSSPPRETTDGGLGDALDVVSQHLSVTLSASLSKSLASLATSCHC